MPRVLPLVTFPAKSLKQPSVKVEKVTSRISDLVQDMFVTMKASQGIGLAAPQIGENLNLFVMDVDKPDPIDPEKMISNPLCLINPRIISSQGIIAFEEGCLSCPDLLVKIDRSETILVEFLDAEGRLKTLQLKELEAVCVQHEMDHLAGILLTDRLSQIKRSLYKKQRIRDKKNEDDLGDV